MPMPGGACLWIGGEEAGCAPVCPRCRGRCAHQGRVPGRGQAVAAAGHPFAAGVGGMMGCAVRGVGGVNQSGDRAGSGVMTCTTRADPLPVCGVTPHTPSEGAG
jgi:hypothetical protein